MRVLRHRPGGRRPLTSFRVVYALSDSGPTTEGCPIFVRPSPALADDYGGASVGTDLCQSVVGGAEVSKEKMHCNALCIISPEE